MILGEVFERFASDSPVSVMARAALEHALPPQAIDELFERVAERQYTDILLFSSVVDLLAAVVCRVRSAVNSAYQARADSFAVSIKAVYEKLNRTEPQVSAALLRQSAERPGPVDGLRTKIIDGNHFAGTEHRLKGLRAQRAGALPGQALVVLDPQSMLATDVFGCEDGHAQERALLGEVLPTVRPGELWVADRGFCTMNFLFGIAERGGRFAIRQHASSCRIELRGEPRACGRVETGRVAEQDALLGDGRGGTLPVRRVTITLDRPTREGESEIHVLTNLAESEATAAVVAEAYRGRWTIEGAFGELSACLDGEIATLAYPRAALLAFCVALVASNMLSVVRASLRCGPPTRAVSCWHLRRPVNLR